MSIKQQLEKIIKKKDMQLSVIANKILEETKNKLKEATDELWYDTYPNPIDYNRTYELLNSIDGKLTKNGIADYTIQVYFNPKKMTSRSGKGWNIHQGFSGEDFRKGLIASIINGVGGSLNNPRLGDSTDVINIVQKYAEEYANKLLKQYL